LFQNEKIEETVDFKTHFLPLTRIKKILKVDGEVSMISAKTPIMFVKACEMFIIIELTRSCSVCQTFPIAKQENDHSTICQI